MSTKKKYNQVIYTSVNSINTIHWEEVVKDKNIYLSSLYLTALEKTMNNEIEFFYSIVYNEKDIPVLVSVFQLVNFIDKRNNKTQSILKQLTIRRDENDSLSMKILVCGNVFSDGENGFLWNNKIDDNDAIEQITIIAKKIKKDKETRKKLSLILFKDFRPQSTKYTDGLKDFNYKGFMIDVNMVLPIHKTWKSMDDYFFSMKTKFRTRSKSVYKKSALLELKSLTHLEIEKNSERIDELFSNVLEKSEYSFGFIKSKSFAELKKNLLNSFSFRGLFLEQELIGFSTSFLHKGVMEANYVGIDYKYNTDYCIYQRLLYDYVYQAIQNNASELQLGRTSELIKSALGAEPVNMKLYAKHKKAISNVLMSSFLCFVSPSKFELRKPFKVNFNN